MSEYYGSPRISSEYKDCSMPMTFDQHKGCGYQCLYCFAYYKRYTDPMSREDYQKNIVKCVNIDNVLNLLNGKKIGSSQRMLYENFIKQKKVIQWGSLGDPFCTYEKERGTGLPILKAMAELKYPVSLSTKSTWFAYDKRYTDILKSSPETFHIKFSIITSDAEKASKIEQKVPTPKKRFEAMKTISDMGIATTLRLRPYFIGLTNTDIEKTIRSAADAGAISVSTEFFCLDIRATLVLKQRYKDISKVIGYDLMTFYKKNSSPTGYLRLNRNVKEPYVIRLKELCDENNLKLYVSDPDFKELSCHGSCCGIPKSESFENFSKSQLTNLLVYMRDNDIKRISWDEYVEMYKEDFEWQKQIGMSAVYALGKHAHHMKRNMTLFDHNRNVWNNPNQVSSPYRYLNGTLKPVGLNDKGNMVYEYMR